MNVTPAEQGHYAAWIAETSAPVLVTGAAGFVGSRVVASLLRLGFTRIVCGVRRSSDRRLLQEAIAPEFADRCRIVEANLLSRDECRELAAGAEIVFHLVAGRGKSFPHCFQGSVISTRNVLDAVLDRGGLRRFVNVSSLAVYSNFRLARGAVWDESCPLEDNLDERYDAYIYGKLKQDELVQEYHARHGLPTRSFDRVSYSARGRRPFRGSSASTRSASSCTWAATACSR